MDGMRIAKVESEEMVPFIFLLKAVPTFRKIFSSRKIYLLNEFCKCLQLEFANHT